MNQLNDDLNVKYFKGYNTILLLLWGGIASLIILRCRNAVLYPILFYEDGTEMLSFYSNSSSLYDIFRFYGGYISLLPNLIGYITASFFPLYIAPYMMVAFSVVSATAAFSFFSLKRFRFIMPDDNSRMLVCFMAALIPLGNHALTTNLTYSLWHIFFISLLMIIAPPPESKAAMAAQMLFLVLAICSHPLSILFIPICSVLILYRKSFVGRIYYISIIAVALIYAVFGTESTPRLASRINAESILTTFNYIVQRVIFEPILGGHLRSVLYKADLSIVIYLFTTLVIILFCKDILRKINSSHPPEKRHFLQFALVIFLIFFTTLSTVVGRKINFERLLLDDWNHRYFYIQQLLFVFSGMIFVLLRLNIKKIMQTSKLSFLIILVIYFSYLNIANSKYFYTSKEQGVAIIGFLKTADAMRHQNNGQKQPSKLVMDRGGRWDITINASALSKE